LKNRLFFVKKRFLEQKKGFLGQKLAFLGLVLGRFKWFSIFNLIDYFCNQRFFGLRIKLFKIGAI